MMYGVYNDTLYQARLMMLAVEWGVCGGAKHLWSPSGEKVLFLQLRQHKTANTDILHCHIL